MPARSSPPRSSPASPRARTSRSRRRSTPRSASSSAATPSRRSERATLREARPAAGHALETGGASSRTAEQTRTATRCSPRILLARPAHAGALRARHLRRLRRPDAPQALPRALLARDAQAPAGEVRRSSAPPAREWTDDEFREQMEHAVREFGRDDFDEDVWDWLAKATHYVAVDFADDEPGRQAPRSAERARREARHARQPRLLPRRPAARDRRCSSREIGERRKAEGWTRLIVEKPFGHDLASARELNAQLQRALRRGRGLPHRPLPRQGDRPEPARAAVRERDLRADLEPAVRRPHPDHGRRDDRDRGTRRLLRAGRRDPRHLPEPPAAARRADRDGAADRLQRRLGPQREGEGAQRAAHARPEARRPRAVRTRLHRGPGGARLPRGGRRRAGLDDGDVRRREALRRQLALGRHAVLPAGGQAAGAARDHDRDRVQARAAPALRDHRGRPAAERAASCHIQPDEGVSLEFAPRCRARG